MSNFTTLYIPPNLTLWQGRADAQPQEYFYQIIKPLNLKQPEFKRNKTQAQFAILGFACKKV